MVFKSMNTLWMRSIMSYEICSTTLMLAQRKDNEYHQAPLNMKSKNCKSIGKMTILQYEWKHEIWRYIWLKELKQARHINVIFWDGAHLRVWTHRRTNNDFKSAAAFPKSKYIMNIRIAFSLWPLITFWRQFVQKLSKNPYNFSHV